MSRAVEMQERSGKILVCSMLVLSLTANACGGRPRRTSRSNRGTSDAGAGSLVDAGDCAGWTVAQQWCEAQQARAACYGDPFDMAECLQSACCVFSFVRPDAPAAIVPCLGTLSCDEPDDRCFDPNQLGLPPRPEDTTYTEACLDKWSSCGGPFADDYCYAGIVSEALRNQLEACLDESCDQVRDCFRNAFSEPNACFR